MDGQAEAKQPDSRHWQEVANLLAAGQYDDAAKILQETEAAADTNGDLALKTVLQVARQICLTGNDYHTEAEIHREAYRAATAREQQLRQQLQSLLNLIGAQIKVVDEGEQSTTGGNAGDRREIPGLIRRLKNLLGHRTDPQAEVANDPPPPIDDPAVRLRDPSPLAEVPEPPPLESAVPHVEAQKETGPSLAIYCLGAFRVYDNDRMIDEWTGNKCRSILKYMVLRHDQPVHRDVLIDLFWRDDDPEAARRNLYQAIYTLRQALQAGHPDFQYVLCQNSHYLFSPELDLWIDFQAFLTHYHAGQRLERERRMAAAIREYETAENFYEGPLLPEDLYEEWTLVMRERLKNAYLDALDRVSRYYWTQRQFALCVAYCQKILLADSCREDAHRRLMLAYMQQGHRHLALRQYHRCVEAFRQELDTEPMPETHELYEKIKKNKL